MRKTLEDGKEKMLVWKGCDRKVKKIKKQHQSERNRTDEQPMEG